MTGEKFFRWVRPPGGDGDGACAEMARTGDVIGRIADDDELRGLEIKMKMATDALLRDGRKIAAVVRVIAECAWKLEEV